MARIILGSYMVRYPLGGNLSWAFQYLIGFQRLGHEVYFVEKSGYANSCYDPVADRMTDDCSQGISIVAPILDGIGLANRWCYVDAAGRYYGLSRPAIEEVFRSADVFIDMGTHGSWLNEAAASQLRVLVDAEPGLRQLKMQNTLEAGGELPEYDVYFTKGWNVANGRSAAPTAGRHWRGMFHPVVTDRFETTPSPQGAPFTTVMNWRSYERVERRGETFGHKDLEFEKFIALPRRTSAPLELAVSGKATPTSRLCDHGWRLRDAHQVTRSIASFVEYLRTSRGEFTVCKHGFVSLRTGWFSDRSAAYLASGRPVVMQDTGFSEHLPVGRGLFAVNTVEEAATAIDEIETRYDAHCRWAREIAKEHLEATRVLRQFLDEIGVSRSHTTGA